MKRIITEANENWLYMQLHMFQRGHLEPKQLNDPLIREVRKNGIVFLGFDPSEYFELFNFDDYDLSILNHLFSSYYYSSFELKDHYSCHSDWDEGYIFNYFDNENKELLERLKSILLPNIDENEEPHILAQFLGDNFTRETGEIVDDFYIYTNDAIDKEISSAVEEDLCDVFFSYNIFVGKCFRSYYTTVPNLIKLYDQFNDKSLDITGLLKKIVSEKMDITGGYSDWYEYDWDRNFDFEAFNLEVRKELTTMIDRLEDSDLFVNIEEFKKLSEKLSKFTFNHWFDLPKNDKVMFKIKTIDPKTNKILFEYLVKGTSEVIQKSLDYENFMLFLYHPELF